MKILYIAGDINKGPDALRRHKVDIGLAGEPALGINALQHVTTFQSDLNPNAVQLL